MLDERATSAYAYHAQLTTQVRSTDPPKDYVVNNLYFGTSVNPTSADLSYLATQLVGIMCSSTGFGGVNPWTPFSGRSCVSKIYNFADPKPRPVLATATHTPGTWESGALAPRMLALCLSYYSGRNLPHSRGRIYLGPFLNSFINETPIAQQLNMFMDLAKGLNTIPQSPGGVIFFHCTHSTVTGDTLGVDHYWANDVWDAQHSREHSESLRVRYP